VANIQIEGNARDLEEECKVLASCAYEENTQWGIEVSLSLPPSPSLSLSLSRATVLDAQINTIKQGFQIHRWV
jgi:hypothetical protein